VDTAKWWEQGRHVVKLISLVRVAFFVLIVSTVVFVYFFGRLLHEKQQALQEQAQVREQVLYEEKRHRDLEALFAQSNEDWVLIQEAARIFGVAVPGTVVVRVEEPVSGESSGGEVSQERTSSGEPVWQMWRQAFHLSP